MRCDGGGACGGGVRDVMEVVWCVRFGGVSGVVMRENSRTERAAVAYPLCQRHILSLSRVCVCV